ncbi:hypothetical protein [Chryseobacterium daecheongense]|uniref:Uncharacterized protein n=1 Tax=Chryseobacterium daecheongense TaxID=192389 RepID=A0A3N0W320_9FLAO|nr:hypothetical protein [Chryseobacterium daecheongense]ROH99384.1 hypothetical protein EGI05_00355 [Chryseobacterium daecheongense]TDX95720.1 hypothetical protein BCF50_1503 [Chryseobacterium daecheongense]
MNQFFENNIVQSSLEEYYNKKIIIYDEKKVLTNKPIQYQNDSISLNIQTTQPLDNSFFRIYDFILNKDLGFVVFSTSDRSQGILYYLKRNNKNNKWEIMEMKKRFSK